MDFEDTATSSPSGSPTEPYCYEYTDTDLGERLFLVLVSISILCCLIIILAITIPLFNKEERNNMSAYNLYLVYLAIPDLIVSIAFFAGYTSCRVQFDTWTILLVASTFAANILINSVILYELLKMLIDSKTRRRPTPPSLFKASMQALLVYAVSIMAGITRFLGHFDIMLRALLVFAFVYILWVLIRICYGRLLCYNSDSLDRLKVLVIYFARIIGLNMVSGTAYILSIYLAIDSFFYVWLMIKISIGFGLSLTKPDVLEYVRRLFAGVVRPCSKIDKNGDPTPAESEPNETDNPSRDPKTSDPNRPCDCEKGDKHVDGSVHMKEETEDWDRQENAEATTTSVK